MSSNSSTRTSVTVWTLIVSLAHHGQFTYVSLSRVKIVPHADTAPLSLYPSHTSDPSLPERFIPSLCVIDSPRRQHLGSSIRALFENYDEDFKSLLKGLKAKLDGDVRQLKGGVLLLRRRDYQADRQNSAKLLSRRYRMS